MLGDNRIHQVCTLASYIPLVCIGATGRGYLLLNTARDKHHTILAEFSFPAVYDTVGTFYGYSGAPYHDLQTVLRAGKQWYKLLGHHPRGLVSIRERH